MGHSSDVTGLAWSTDGKYLASCALDKTIIIWSAQNFSMLAKLEEHQGFVKGISFDPLGKYLASQADDNSLLIWRTRDWKIEKKIEDPFKNSTDESFFRRLSWSADGSFVVAANASSGASVEEGNVAVAAVIDRQNWNATLSLVGHSASIESTVLSHVIVGLSSFSL